MSKGHFLLIDSQKNTLRIPTGDAFLRDVFQDKEIKNNIKRHKTKGEFDKEVSDYLKGGGKE